MKDISVKLKSALLKDLSAIFDGYQLESISAGKPLWPDATLTQVQCYALANSITKKYCDADRPSKEACKAALDKFLVVNSRCKDWVYAPESSRDLELFGEFKSSLYDFWYPPEDVNHGSVCDSLDAAMHAGRVGGGASVCNRAPDFYTKLFDGPLSSSRQCLLDFWKATMNRYPLWANAERTRATRYTDRIVRGNRLSFVPKNVSTARCIATEPTVNSWFQQGLRGLMEERLKKFSGINLSTQPQINGALARVGSIDGSYATIDLESASDSISIKMLDHLAPKGLVRWLKLFRSDEILLPGNRPLKLETIATMGNAFTFPLETVIFNCAVLAVYKLRGIKTHTVANTEFDPQGRNYGVFGDDIIVRTEAAAEVIHLLSLLGFVVNSSKTHVEGPFRESCGFDWYSGEPCRGVYIKRLVSAQDHYVAINTLNRWSAMTGVSLQFTVGFLLAGVISSYPRVPPDEDDTAGVHVPSDLAHGIKRGLHGSWKYRKDAPVVVGYAITGEDQYNVQIVPVPQSEGALDRLVNRAGLLLSFIGGYMEGSRAGVDIQAFCGTTNRSVTYCTKHAVTPMWDYYPTQPDPLYKMDKAVHRRPLRSLYYDFAAWSAAVTCNI